MLSVFSFSVHLICLLKATNSKSNNEMIKKIENNFDFVHLRSFTLRRFPPGRFSFFCQKYMSAL